MWVIPKSRMRLGAGDTSCKCLWPNFLCFHCDKLSCMDLQTIILTCPELRFCSSCALKHQCLSMFKKVEVRRTQSVTLTVLMSCLLLERVCVVVPSVC
jgi:hypothetical protein